MTPKEKQRAYNTAWQANKRGNPALLEAYRRQFPQSRKGGRPKDPSSLSALIRRAEGELDLIRSIRGGDWAVIDSDRRVLFEGNPHQTSRFIRARTAERVIFLKYGRKVELREEDVVNKNLRELIKEGASK